MYSEDGDSPVAGSYNQTYPASFASEANNEQDAYYTGNNVMFKSNNDNFPLLAVTGG